MQPILRNIFIHVQCGVPQNLIDILFLLISYSHLQPGENSEPNLAHSGLLCLAVVNSHLCVPKGLRSVLGFSHLLLPYFAIVTTILLWVDTKVPDTCIVLLWSLLSHCCLVSFADWCLLRYSWFHLLFRCCSGSEHWTGTIPWFLL